MLPQDSRYFCVQSWMVSKLKLKGAERDVYAIVYAFSQDKESDFHGSLGYIAELTGYSRNAICTALKNLTDKKLLIKTDFIINNIKHCRYRTSNLDGVQVACTGVQVTCTNNKDNKNNKLFISKDINNSQKPAEQEVQSFVDLYHKICTDFPKVKKVTAKRKKAILNIIANYKYGDIKTVMHNLQNSDFCKGNNSRGWKADIDFILREDKFISTLEGKYDNPKNNGPNKFGEFEGMSTDGYTEEELEAMRKGQPNGQRTYF